MINNARDAILTARNVISGLLLEREEVDCTFLHGGTEIKGVILAVNGKGNNPSVKIRSHTGNERSIMITLLVSVDGVDEL